MISQWWQKSCDFLLNTRNLLYIYIFIIALATFVQYIKPDKNFSGRTYPPYNNYLIFTQSFNHLVEGENIYKEFPEDHFDLYKYTPSFSVLMAPFSLLSTLPGMMIWCLLNAMLLFFGIKYLPYLNDRMKAAILVFILMEVVTANQNVQSNSLMTGLLLLSFVFLEKGKIPLATFILVLSCFLKLFGLVFFMLFLFYPNKIKAAIYSLLWFGLFALLPVLFISWDQMIFLYKEWLNVLIHDSNEAGLSIYGVIKSWFETGNLKNWIFPIGVVIMCLPLLRWHHYVRYEFRLLILSALLIWVVIFSYESESPTYIIAATGVGIWYFTLGSQKLDTFIVITVFILTILSPSDLFPDYLRANFVKPFFLKAFACVLAWFKIMYDLLSSGLKFKEIKKT